MNEVVAKGAFLSRKYTHPFMQQYMLLLSKKQHEGRHAPLLFYCKHMTKRGIAESLRAQITAARLTACEVGIFLREISQLSKNTPTPSFRSHLSSSPVGVLR